MKTAIKTVKGLGSASNGVAHWWMQRISAIALIPLYVWFVLILFKVAKGNIYFVDIFNSLIQTILFSILLITSLYHSTLGIKVIIEDYVSCEKLKFGLIIFTNLFVILTAIFLGMALLSQYIITLTS